MSERGMKKWAPYASLIEQKGTIQQMKQQRARITKPLLSQEMAMEINGQLLQSKGQHVHLTFFENQNKKILKGVVEKIDFDQKWLTINQKTVTFRSILSMKIELPTK
jgi:hypothetical protein